MKKWMLLLTVVCLLLAAINIKASDDSQTFSLCDSSNVYRIDDDLLAQRGFGSSPLVESNPQFPGRVEALQKFFDEKLKLKDEAKNVFVRVHIKFVVNCKGNVGDFKIISPAAPEIADEILKVAEQMPDWEAGQNKGKAVDTITKLAFTVSQGRAKVSYK